MPSLLKPILRGEHENHLLPFFWQHGESEAVLRETIAKIAESHIGAVCVESRPHPDFVGPAGGMTWTSSWTNAAGAA